jgi:hypothetical protein
MCHDIPFRWDEHAQTNFDELKVALSNAPLISPLDYDRDYILYLSALIVSVAGVLIQLGDDGREHVIYYISKNISGPPLKRNHDENLVRKIGPWSNKIKQMQKQNTEDTQYNRDTDLRGSPSVGYVHQRNCQVLPLLLSSK